VINTLIAHHHGPLANILDNYTMDHAQGFLRQIDQQESLGKLNRIHEFRVAQLDNTAYKEKVGQMVRAYNASYRRESASSVKPILTPREQAAFDAQQHWEFNNLPRPEREKLNKEIDVMWAQIPEHLQDKAQRMAGLR
jgi:hypothetical protein